MQEVMWRFNPEINLVHLTQSRRCLVSGAAQGKVAASSMNILAKKPDDWSKGMILCITVEFYAILSLLASFMMLNGITIG